MPRAGRVPREKTGKSGLSFAVVLGGRSVTSRAALLLPCATFGPFARPEARAIMGIVGGIE